MRRPGCVTHAPDDGRQEGGHHQALKTSQDCVDDVHGSDVYRSMSLNQSLVGKRFPPPAPVTISARDADGFALATNAPVAGGSAPPMFAVTWGLPAIGAVLFDPLLGVDMMRLLHSEHDLRFGEPVLVDDVIVSTANIDAIEAGAAGEFLMVRVTSTNTNGTMVADALARIFIRGPRQRDPRIVDAADDVDPFLALPARFSTDVVVADDQAHRYADASGDHNPIHLDEDAARQAGLPGCILHNLCTMAFVYNAVVQDAAGSARVRRLKVRFERPVLLGDTLTIEGRTNGDGTIALRVRNQAGATVIDDGVAEVG
jgi:acyl dehydratase